MTAPHTVPIKDAAAHATLVRRTVRELSIGVRDPRGLWPEHARRLYDHLVALYKGDLLPALAASWIAHQRSVNTQKSYAQGFRTFEKFAREHGSHPMAVNFRLADTFRLHRTSTLSRATSGESVPSASTMGALAKALGASPNERSELLTLRNQAARATATRETNESNRSDSPGITHRAEKDDAGTEHSLTVLARQLVMLMAAVREEAQKQLLVSLHIAAGAPSVREIADRTGLPRSTVHQALTGQSTSGAKKVAYSLVAQLKPEDRDDWAAKVASTFQDATSPAEALPLFRATSPGGRMDAERAFSEFTDSLRRFRNLIVHGDVEADALFRVQVMALAALVEERLAPPADPRYPDWPPADFEPLEMTVEPEGGVIESADEPSWPRESRASEQASGRRGEA